MSSTHAKGSMKTPNGQKYVLQLFKHWSHKPGAVIDDAKGTIAFEGGNGIIFDVQSECLNIDAHIGAEGDLEHWKSVVESHLKRFAFREEFDLVWEQG